MKILKRYALKKLLFHKKRTVVLLMGIMLTSALLTSISTLANSAYSGIRASAIKEGGDYQAMFYQVPNDKKSYILHHQSVKKAMQVQPIGVGILDGSQNLYKPYIHVMGFDDAAIRSLPIHLTKGRLPKNNQEIMLAQHIVYNGKVNVEVGDVITLNLGERYLLKDNRNIANTASYNENNEGIRNEKAYIFTVSGFFERPNFEETTSASYSAITTFDTSLKSVSDIYVNYQDDVNVIDETKKIAKQLELAGNKITYDFHYELISLNSSVKGGRLSYLVNLVAIFTAAVILIGSSTLLYNSFSMNMHKERQYLALLQSGGATLSQIRYMLFYEGVLLSIIAIPIGILLGVGAVYGSLDFINQQVSNMSLSMNYMLFTCDVFQLLLCALGVFGIVEFCIWLPLRKLDTSLIQNIRQQGRTQVKHVSILSKHLPLSLRMARKHIRFQRRTQRNIIISLTTLIVLFVSFHSMMFNVQELRDTYSLDSNADISLTFEGSNRERVMKEINQLATENTHLLSMGPYYYSLDIYDLLSDVYKEENQIIESDTMNYSSVVIYGVDDDAITTLNGGKAAAPHDTPILYALNRSAVSTSEQGYPFQKGGKSKINVLYDELGNQVNLDLDIKIAQGDIEFLNYRSSIILLASFQDMEKIIWNEFILLNKENSGAIQEEPSLMSSVLSDRNYTVFFKTSLSNALEEELQNLNATSEMRTFQIENYDRMYKEQRSMKLLTNLLFYGFMVVVFIVGFTNIINTAHGEFTIRKKEFAMLMSVGMRKRQLAMMLIWENFIYALTSLILAIFLNKVVNELMYYLFQRGLMGYNQTMMWMDYVYCMGIAVLFIIVILCYQLVKLKKYSLMEMIREQDQ